MIKIPVLPISPNNAVARLCLALCLPLIVMGFLYGGASRISASADEPGSIALVQIDIHSPADLAIVANAGIPVYAQLSSATGQDYVLAGADSLQRVDLAGEGLDLRVLDRDLEGATFYLVYVGPGQPQPDWGLYGRRLLDDGRQVLVRASPHAAEQLAQSGAELQSLTLVPKPLYPAHPAVAIPAAIQPDPIVQLMIDQVVSPTVYAYTSGLSGEQPVQVGGSPYTLTTRHTYSGQPIQKATQYVGEYMTNLGLDVEYHQWNGATYPNVIGELTGELNPDDIFIICAHLDDLPSSGLAPGADDNASGSVAVLMAADILSQYNWGCTLRFAFWTGEEQGLLGSAAYAQRAHNTGENILGVLNLDMIAWNTPGSSPDIDLHARSTLPQTLQLAQLFVDVVDAYNLNLIPEIVSNGSGASDHASFWTYGYTAILGIEDYYPSYHDFNPYYHTSNDRLQYLDMLYYTDFVKASLGTFAHMSGCLIPSGIGYLDGHVSQQSSGAPIAGATVAARGEAGQVFSATTDVDGYYTRTLLAGAYTVTVAHPHYTSVVTTGIQVVTDSVTTLDLQLARRGRLWGYVTDYDNGFPLTATIVSEDGLAAASNAFDGYYELYLDGGAQVVTATAENYAPASASVVITPEQDTRQDWILTANASFYPSPLYVAVLLNDSLAITTQLINRQPAPYSFQLYEIDGGFTPTEQTVATWPGPDGYGYVGESIDYDWIDIHSTGALVSGLTDDSSAGPFNIDFTFPFYGANQTQFFVSSNGFISFGSGSSATDNTCPLPNSAAPNNIIAPMWDDLYPNYSTGGVYYQTFSSCPMGSGACLIVQYYNWLHYTSSPPYPAAGTFEIILFQNGSVAMQFLDSGVELGSGSTTGLEGNNAAADHGLTYMCNAPNSIADASSTCYVYPGSWGCLASDVLWLGQSVLQGTVPASQTLDVTVFFTATPAVGVSQVGDYNAMLVVQGDPTLRIPVTMTVFAQPVSPTASFVSNLPVCLGTAMSFNNTSTPGFPLETDYLWDLGDGITSTLVNPTHFYSIPGFYTVTLRACNTAGCDTFSDTVQVLTMPAAGFDFVVDELVVTFTNTTSNATAYVWHFGDGLTSTLENPSHTYTNQGAWPVTLEAVNSSCVDLASAQVSVGRAPQASFASNSPACLDTPMVFTNTTLGTPPFYSVWNFGDDITSTQTHPTHGYASAGFYTVTLRVDNTFGNSETASPIEVRPLPEASFSSVADWLAVEFTNLSTHTASYLWNFGDSVTSTLMHPTHTYAAVGSFTVTLTAMGECGTDVFTQALSVNAQPCNQVTGVNLTLVTTGTVYTDTLATFNVDVLPNGATKPYSYTIDYADGVTDTANSYNNSMTLTHTFSSAENYTVEISVWNCLMTVPVTSQVGVTVNEKPSPLPYRLYLPLIIKD